MYCNFNRVKSIIGILLFLPMLCMAQVNIVPNPSFEDYTECPTGWTHDWSRVTGWSNANGSSPDFFHICGETSPSGLPLRGVPENQAGFQESVTGEAYMGFYGVQMGNAEWREYIQVELTEAVEIGTKYQVSFYISLSENSRYGISTIGAYLSETAPSGNDLLVLEAEPQIMPKPLQPITDTINWVLVTDTFISRHGGGERFITIGNFFSDAESDTTFVNPNAELGALHAYYYIDDVSVVALDSVPDGIEELNELGLEVWPNPVQEVLRFSVGDSHGRSSLGMTDIRIRVLDGIGREVTSSSALGGHSPSQGGEPLRLNVSALPPGIYFLELTTENGTRAVRKFVKE